MQKKHPDSSRIHGAFFALITHLKTSKREIFCHYFFDKHYRTIFQNLTLY
jgi:hypothetical protein